MRRRLILVAACASVASPAFAARNARAQGGPVAAQDDIRAAEARLACHRAMHRCCDRQIVEFQFRRLGAADLREAGGAQDRRHHRGRIRCAPSPARPPPRTRSSTEFQQRLQVEVATKQRAARACRVSGRRRDAHGDRREVARSLRQGSAPRRHDHGRRHEDQRARAEEDAAARFVRRSGSGCLSRCRGVRGACARHRPGLLPSLRTALPPASSDSPRALSTFRRFRRRGSGL